MPDRKHPYRIGSEAPASPGPGACDASWPGAWEDRVESRPRCALEPGHAGAHRVERAGFDGRCFSYTWSDFGEEARREPC